MPAKSQQQMKYIYAMRNKYKSKRKAPKNMKWVFDEEWTKGVKMKKLPNKIKNESHIMNFRLFNESEANVDYEGDEEDYMLYGEKESTSEEKISESKVGIKDTYVEFEEVQTNPKFVIVTTDNKKYFINLKSFYDFDDEDEW